MSFFKIASKTLNKYDLTKEDIFQLKVTDKNVKAPKTITQSKEPRRKTTKLEAPKSRLRGGMQCPVHQQCPMMPQMQQCPFQNLPFNCSPALMYGPNTCGATPVILITLPSSPHPSTPAPKSPSPYPSTGQDVKTPQKFALPAIDKIPSALGESVDAEKAGVRIKIIPATPSRPGSGRPCPGRPPSGRAASTPRGLPSGPSSQQSRVGSPRAGSGKRPPPFVSDSTFQEPAFHSSVVVKPPSLLKSAVGEAPKVATFQSLERSDESQGTPLVSYDSAVIDSEFLRDLDKSEGSKMISDELKKNKQAILENALEAKRLKDLMAQGGEEHPSLVEQYRQRKQNIMELMRDANRLRNAASKSLVQAEPSPPKAEDVDMEVELYDALELTPATRKMFHAHSPTLKALICPPGGLPSYTLPSPDSYLGPNFDELVDEGLEPNTPAARQQYDTEKRQYADLKRSFDRAKGLEHEIVAKVPSEQADEEEKEAFRNLLQSYFKHRRNLVHHLLYPQ